MTAGAETPGFNAWLLERTGMTGAEMCAMLLRCGSTPRAAEQVMDDTYRHYRLYVDGLGLDFLPWLEHRTGMKQEALAELALAAGTAAEYAAMMDWYRNRYVMETENPFFAGEEPPGMEKNNGT